jgi:sterol desaturase/sphingolipid hydroxylase (fatty acid hydroxylase superfamily)
MRPMSDGASVSDGAFLNRHGARLLMPHGWAASISKAEESTEDTHRGQRVSAAKTSQVRMSNGKVSYYADFTFYSALVIASVAFTLRGSRSDQLLWLRAAIAGLGSWTLVEYLLHRFVFHRMPLICDLHHAHHAAPRAYVSTPTWVSLLVLGGLFFLPVWRLFTLNVAFGAVTGLITGWLWYGFVHHVIHYRRPRRLAVALKAASHRHLLHHAASGSGNYGVTTPIWDYVFGTNVPARARAMNIAVRQPAQTSCNGLKTHEV